MYSIYQHGLAYLWLLFPAYQSAVEFCMQNFFEMVRQFSPSTGWLKSEEKSFGEKRTGLGSLKSSKFTP
jgi:hypothetical protein